jgi:DNA-binding MarR family transcriptional regulator
MSSDKKNVRITLTPEQRAQVREMTGKDAEALELSAQELEERIAPWSHGY